MKILWISNIIFPEALKILTGEGTLKSSGGWLLGLADALVRTKDISLSVAFLSPLVNELRVIQGEKLNYYIIPYGKGNLKYNKEYEVYWKSIQEKTKPDVVHIHGTEYSHGLAYINACGATNVVVSIQGLVSAVNYYYYYGLSISDIIKNITLRDLLRGTIFQDKKSFKLRGELEKELLLNVHHVIGRTSWDLARTLEINPNINYHFCNETLRPDFYDGSVWSYRNCKKHSIFLSQASYPIKGLHQLLKAMPIILRYYPDTIIRIAGVDITQKKQYKGVLSFITGYGLLVKKMINSLELDGHVLFVGNLNAEEMKQEYLKANVFVCPSSIENSPNSLGEAQILGVPCVCSYVGGIPDMMRGDEGHLYRFEETSMLAKCICDIFANKGSQVNMKDIARARHDKDKNTRDLLNIYKEILSKQ